MDVNNNIMPNPMMLHYIEQQRNKALQVKEQQMVHQMEKQNQLKRQFKSWQERVEELQHYLRELASVEYNRDGSRKLREIEQGQLLDIKA